MAPSPALSHAIESFTTWLRVERNLAPRTRQAYLYDLERFHAWFSALVDKQRPTLSQVQANHLQSYLAHLRDDLNYKATTSNRVVASIRTFFRYCVDERLLSKSPAEDLRRPKLPKKLPIYLVREELEKLFDSPNRDEPKGRRDYAILITFAYTGMRLSELAGLDVQDLDFGRDTIRVFGKGRKERLVPMNLTVIDAIEAMLKDEDRQVAQGEKGVFLNMRGTRLTGRSLEYIVEKHVRESGIGKKGISPHKLRHSFATLLHGANIELVDIQQLMGHASLASTQIYTHTNANRLRSAIDKLDFGD